MYSVMCSVVAKVYQLWGAAGFFLAGVGGGGIFFVILGVLAFTNAGYPYSQIFVQLKIFLISY